MTAASVPIRPADHRPVRAVSATVALCAIVAAAFVLSMTVGRYPVSPLQVVQALAGGGDPATGYVVTGLRLPRAAVGVAAGALLALSGALTQSFARNPLASPDVIGVTQGASAAAVAAVVLGGGTYALSPTVSSYGIPVAATLGGLSATALVFGLAWRGDLAPDRVVLVGIGVAGVAGAAVSWLLIAASIGEAGQAAVWLAGSLNGRGTQQLWPLLVVAAVTVPAAALLRRPLAVSALGDDVARSLGVRLRSMQAATVAVAAVMAAGAVAASGPVEFVALVAPQLAVRLVGGARIPLAASAATGAALVTLADVVGRTVTSHEIPVGLVTAALGAPYLIWLLARRRREPTS